jgi:hypothetical protein
MIPRAIRSQTLVQGCLDMSRWAPVCGALLCMAALPLDTQAATCDPLPMPGGRSRAVRTAADLQDAVRSAGPDSVIVVEEGIYELTATLDIRAPGVTLRGRSADPSKTILRGAGMSEERVGIGIAVSAPRVTIAHLSAGSSVFTRSRFEARPARRACACMGCDSSTRGSSC